MYIVEINVSMLKTNYLAGGVQALRTRARLPHMGGSSVHARAHGWVHACGELWEADRRQPHHLCPGDEKKNL